MVASLQTAFKAADTNGPTRLRRGRTPAQTALRTVNTQEKNQSGALGLHPGFAVWPSSQSSETPSVKSGGWLSQSLKPYSTSNTLRSEDSLWGICSWMTMSRVFL